MTCSNSGLTRIVTVLTAWLAVSPSLLAAELFTIEQAEAISKATGRPILAMAGSKT